MKGKVRQRARKYSLIILSTMPWSINFCCKQWMVVMFSSYVITCHVSSKHIFVHWNKIYKQAHLSTVLLQLNASSPCEKRAFIMCEEDCKYILFWVLSIISIHDVLNGTTLRKMREKLFLKTKLLLSISNINLKIYLQLVRYLSF